MSRLHTALLLLLGCLWLPSSGCPKSPPSEPGPKTPQAHSDTGDRTSTAEILQGEGIVMGAQLEARPPGNLTREESEVLFHCLHQDREVSPTVWIELVQPGSPAEAAPLYSGRAGRPIGAAPGTYHIRFQYERGPLAVGHGAISLVTLSPGQRYEARVQLRFPTGHLETTFRNGDHRVNGETRVRIQREGRTLLEVEAGQGTQLPAGEYTVLAVWSPVPEFERVQPLVATIRPDQTTRIDFDFDLDLSLATVHVRHVETEADWTEHSELQLRTRAGQIQARGPAGVPLYVRAGSYIPVLTLRIPPYVAEEFVLPERRFDASGEGVEWTEAISHPVGHLVIQVLRNGEIRREACEVQLTRHAAASATDPVPSPKRTRSGRQIWLPAGSWDLRVRCPPEGLSRHMPGLVIRPGDNGIRRIVL